MSEYDYDYEDTSSSDIADAVIDGVTELQERTYALKERESILVRRLADLVNAYYAGNNSEMVAAGKKARETLATVDVAGAAGVMSARATLISILADDKKYPQLRIGELTKERINRALRYLE